MTAQHPTGVDAGTRTQRLGQVITCVGLVAGALSLVQTVGHISDAAYLIPGLEDGSGHVPYHLARETMVTLGSFGVILLGLFASRGSRNGRAGRTHDLQPGTPRRHLADSPRVRDGTHTKRN